MQYALFTSPEPFVDEIDLIEKIFDAGLDFLYIQKPHLKDLALERFLLALSESVRQRSFLCGSPNVAGEFGLWGFHASADWAFQNAEAALRSKVRMSVSVGSAPDVQKIAEPLRSKISHFVVSQGEGLLCEKAFVECDATELPEGPENLAVTSGIWEFADPVSAWRRLCKK